MAETQRGDDSSYSQLLNEVRPWLSGYYGRRVPWWMVDDAVQDALVALHEARFSYDSERPFGYWLAAVARYKLVDLLRSLRRSPVRASLDDVSVADHGAAVVSALSVEKLLSALKPAQSEVIQLCKLAGCSMREASQRTGQSVPLVKMNIHRGIARITHIATQPEKSIRHLAARR